MNTNRESQVMMTKVFKLFLAVIGLLASVTLITTTLAMDEDEILSTFYYQNDDSQDIDYDYFDVAANLDVIDILIGSDNVSNDNDYSGYYDDNNDDCCVDDDDYDDEECECYYDCECYEDFVALSIDFLSANLGPQLPYDLDGNPNHVFRAQPQLVTGFDHVSVLRQDGTIWSWGRNEESQLGNGGRVNQHTPVQARTLRNIQQIASQKIHSMALDADGHVWTWGWGGEGQLGVGDPGCNVLPVQVCVPRMAGREDCHAYLSGIVQIDAGMLFSVALHQDGHVYAWGRNSRGQMGDSSLVDRTLPVRLPGLSNIVSVSVGHEHIMALRSDGRVLALGLNSNGQLGDGTLYNRYTPVMVEISPGVPLQNVTMIIAGGFHSYAVTNAGHLYVWGRNHRGQLGLGTVTGGQDRRLHAVRNTNVTNIRDVAVGGEHTLVLHNDGTLTSWGRNNHGQLGTGTTGGDGHYEQGAPQQVRGANGAPLANVALISAGESHSVVMFENGDVHAWGDNWNGQLGRTPEPLYSTTPVQVRAQLRGPNGSLMHSTGTEPLTGITQISAGSMFTLALREGFNDHPGTVWGWGRNNHGQLVMQSTVDHRSAVRLIDFRSDDPRFGTPSGYNLTNAVQISSGTLFAHGFGLALLEDGRVLSWGDNIHGQLGDGTFDASRDGWEAKDHNPRFVVTVARPNNTAPVVPLTNVTQVAAGGRHSVFLMENGTVMAVGLNSSGQLGNDGLHWRVSTPVQVAGITNAVAVTAGIAESFALLDDGTVWGWGRNHHGQLGDGSMVTQYTPVQVYGLENIVKISTGVNYSMALDYYGNIWRWGRQQGVRLCNGDISDAAVPNLVLFEYVPQRCSCCEDYCDCGYLTIDGCGCGEECYCPYPVLDCCDDDDCGYVNCDCDDCDDLNCNCEEDIIVVGDCCDYCGTDECECDDCDYTDCDCDDVDVDCGYANCDCPDCDYNDCDCDDVDLDCGYANCDCDDCDYPDCDCDDLDCCGYYYCDCVDCDGRNCPCGLPTGPFIVYIEAGAYHSLAIDRYGNVWAWGSNSRGQLGNGSRGWYREQFPVQVQNLGGRNIVSVTAGREFTIALASDGTVWSWGSNDVGVLGNHVLNHSATPARVMAGAAATASGWAAREATLNLLSEPLDRPLNPRIEYPNGSNGNGDAAFYPSVLHWNFNSAVRGYRIYVNGETLMEAPEVIPGRPFDLLSLGLEAGEHEIQIRRIGHGEVWSHLSDIVIFETNGPVGAPENVRIENVTNLRWNSVANSIGYYVYVDGTRATARLNGTIFNLASLDLPTARYRIQVRAALPMRMVSPLSTVVIYSSYAMNLANETANEVPGGAGDPGPITALQIRYAGNPVGENGITLVMPNGTRQLSAGITPINTNDRIVWYSNNTNVVTVDANGLLRAVSPGQARIYLRIAETESLFAPLSDDEIYDYVHVFVIPATGNGGNNNQPGPGQHDSSYWRQVSGQWFRYTNGRRQTGWIWAAGQWYFMNPQQGQRGHTAALPVGAMRDGWVRAGGGWYFLNPRRGQDGNAPNLPHGAMRDGWVRAGDQWYFLNPDQGQDGHRANRPHGAMRDGWVRVDGHWYFLNPRRGRDGNTPNLPHGAMHDRWVQTGGQWYFLNPRRGQDGNRTNRPHGAMHDSWLRTGGHWYFLNPISDQDGNDSNLLHGARRTGQIVINGNTYNLNTHGRLVR